MILITGSTGFLGKHLIKVLDKKNIKCLVRKDSNISHLKDIELVYGDITDANSLDKALKDVKEVIHLAASTHDNSLFHIVNVKGTKNLLEACKKNNVKRFVFISSMASTRRFLDDYGRSKKEAEELVRSSGLDYTILRPTLIYGKGSLGMKHTVEYIKRIPFVVPIVGSGNSKIQPVFVDDVCKSIIKSLEKDTINKEYNILGGTRISFNYFIDFVSSRLNVKKVKLHIPTPFVLAGVSCISIIFKNFPIKKEFVKGLGDDTVGDHKMAEKDLGFKFKKISEALTI
jgi:nucleoside-diphosphate-sugar epimerase